MYLGNRMIPFRRPYAGNHDDVIKWKHFPRYWPFVRETHGSPVNSPRKGQWRGVLMFFFNPRLDKQLNKQWRRWWFEPSRSLWRRCKGFQGISSLYALQPQVCQVCASFENKSLSSLWITSCFSSYLARMCIIHNEKKHVAHVCREELLHHDI